MEFLTGWQPLSSTALLSHKSYCRAIFTLHDMSSSLFFILDYGGVSYDSHTWVSPGSGRISACWVCLYGAVTPHLETTDSPRYTGQKYDCLGIPSCSKRPGIYLETTTASSTHMPLLWRRNTRVEYLLLVLKGREEAPLGKISRSLDINSHFSLVRTLAH